MSGAVEGVDIRETMRRVEYDMRHRAMLGSGGFFGERAEVEVIIAALRASLFTPPARSYADGVEEEMGRWTILRKEIESECTASIPKWAEHLIVGGYREQGWAAFDQTNSGCMFASGKWGDSLVLLKDGTIRLLSQGGKA